MEELRAKLHSEEYKNWVKSTLGLKVAKTSVDHYVLERFTHCTEGRESLTAVDIRHLQQHSIKNWITGVTLAQHKTLKHQKWWKCTTTCRDCSTIFDAIIKLHKSNYFKGGLNWENINNLTSEALEWAIAKVFMPQGNEDNKGPEDTDIAALIHIMMWCTLFSNNMIPQNLERIKKVRNELFHSSEYKVTTEDMTEYFDRMIHFVDKASNDLTIKQETKEKIKSGIPTLEEIRDGTMDLEMYEKAYEFRRDGIYHDFVENICKGDIQKVKEIFNIIADIGADIERLRNLKRYEGDKEEYIKQIRKLEEKTKEQEKCMLRFSHRLKEIKGETANMKVNVAELLDSRIAESHDIRNRVNTAMTNYYTKQKDHIQKLKQDNNHLRNSHEQLKQTTTDMMVNFRSQIKINHQQVKSAARYVQERFREDVIQMQHEVTRLKERHIELKHIVSDILRYSINSMQQLNASASRWQQALRNEASRLEAECLIVIVLVTLGMAIILRICLWI